MNSLARRMARGRRDSVRCALVMAGCAVASLSVSAQNFSAGIAAGADRGRVDCVATYPCDRGSSHAKLFAGYRLADGIELQALFFEGGSFKGGDTSRKGTPFGGRFKVRGAGVAVGYRWSPVQDWSLKGQLGVAGVRTRFDYAAPFAGGVSKNTTQPLAGLSVAYAIGPTWQLSLDWDVTRFKAHTTRGSLQMLGIAAQYAF